MSYIDCPKCQKKYHIKAGVCPICHLSLDAAREDVEIEEAALAEKKAKQADAYAKKEYEKSLGKFYCTMCGSRSTASKSLTPGSIVTEVILYLFFIFPGVLYTIWRISSEKEVCPICKHATLIPSLTPISIRNFEHTKATKEAIQ